jgi:hypothetical protein
VQLKPLGNRRTIYGRISRYNLDEYLQLFDFPSPSQTSEQRYSTNVPLQRLFFMNSDFMQQYAERLAARVADEPDDGARIEKAYRLIFGRAATPDEVSAGREFLNAEAGRQYQDRRAAAATADKEPPVTPDPEPEEKDPVGDAEPGEPSADGMMAGVVPGRKPGADAAKMLPVTTFGRYVKVLLSANEFLFVS